MLGWNRAASETGADLSRRPSKVFMSDERAPPRMGNPLERSGSLWHDGPRRRDGAD